VPRHGIKQAPAPRRLHTFRAATRILRPIAPELIVHLKERRAAAAADSRCFHTFSATAGCGRRRAIRKVAMWRAGQARRRAISGAVEARYETLDQLNMVKNIAQRRLDMLFGIMRSGVRFMRASVTGLDKSIPFALSIHRERASVRDRRKAVA